MRCHPSVVYLVLFLSHGRRRRTYEALLQVEFSSEVACVKRYRLSTEASSGKLTGNANPQGGGGDAVDGDVVPRPPVPPSASSSPLSSPSSLPSAQLSAAAVLLSPPHVQCQLLR